MDDTTPNQEKRSNSPSSFAVPRAAITALIEAQADVRTIGAYLTLACHTEETGQFSTASVHAIRNNLNLNKERAEKIIGTLCGIKIPLKGTNPTITLPPQRVRSKRAANVPTVPLIYTRKDWQAHGLGPLPDGPHAHALIRHILPTFDEPLKDRVWFDTGLVLGDEEIEEPLLDLKGCGDVAARLLLAMYAGQEMEWWGGVSPHAFPWQYYKLKDYTEGQIRVLYAERDSEVCPTALFHTIDRKGRDSNDSNACFTALNALKGSGLLYEAVVLLNRNPVPATFGPDANGHKKAYGNIPSDAEILCDIGSPSLYKPLSAVEHGLGPAYVQTATDLNLHLCFPSEYLAVILTGQQAMIAGLYRLRFRVTHDKNAFVKESKQRQLKINQAAFRRLNYLRKAKRLAPLNYGSSTLQSSSIPLQCISMKHECMGRGV